MGHSSIDSTLATAPSRVEPGGRNRRVLPDPALIQTINMVRYEGLDLSRVIVREHPL
ncbi:hypothetical protein BCAR13_70045 [Paraburkholderia caribensis]|nr:hypothetical protein BCAR13_70045 [Paraburkholderia caribensis]